MSQQDPSTINGGIVVAMAGKDCVAIACDLRLGSQSLGVANNFEKIHQYGKTFIGFTGLATDTLTLSAELKYQHNLYKLKENRGIQPETFSNLISHKLYEKRFGPYFSTPVVAGISKQTAKPYIAGFDCIGCIDAAKDFIVSGTASDQLFGMCEALYEPNLEADDLFETISQALLNAADRDAISGWGGAVYMITKDKVTKTYLKTRQD